MKNLCLSGASLLLLCGLVRSVAVSATPDAPVVPPRKIVVFDETLVNAPAQVALVNKFGGTVIKPLNIINGLAAYLPPQAAKAVLKARGVVRIDDDVTVYAVGRPPKPPTPSPTPLPAQTLPWGANRIEADLAWGTTLGLAVKVGVIDTGIDLTHPDLATNIKGNVNTINTLRSANDDNGHGTHVAGTIAALDNTIGVVGVGPQIHLYAVKVLGRSGSGYLSDIIEGIQWCVNHQVQVINMSLGTYSQVQSFHDAVTAAYDSGLVIVAAAGNDGISAPLYPAAYDEVIAVAACDSTDQMAAWSNYGPNIDLTGPGVGIYSTHKGGTYKTLSGTSMATPHVAGAAALVLSTNVGSSYDANGNGIWDPAEVKDKLQDAAEDLGYSTEAQGAGLVRADLAVQ